MPSKKKVSTVKKIVVEKNKSKNAKTTKKVSKDSFIKSVQKRDGEIVPFDLIKITNAINKAMLAGGEGSIEEALTVAKKVVVEIESMARGNKDFIPSVEIVQDSVERQLMLSDYVAASKNYILYRQERARLRAHGISVP